MRAAALAVLLTTLSTPAWAQPRPVGLGAAVGVAIPSKGDLKIDPSFAWGFYTDIPLLSTFSITPSTVLYRVDPENGTGAAATDVSLTFKFVIALGPVEPYAGVTAGVTSAAKLAPHVGGVLGLSLNLVSNLDVFVQGNYRLTIEDGGNIGTFHVFAGPLFRFGR
jgi:hypothetical protein